MKLTRAKRYIGAILALFAFPNLVYAEDVARKVCYADAKKLCPDAVKAMERHKVEICLWQQIDKTSPDCHDMILKIQAERAEAARLNQKPPSIKVSGSNESSK